jgi:hypothetical protein
MNKSIVKQLFDKGWVVSPNNIHSLPGKLMYAGSGNIKGNKFGHETQVEEDRIRVFEIKYFGESHSKKSYIDTVTVAVFDSVDSFLAWIDKNGIFRQGQAAWSQGGID